MAVNEYNPSRDANFCTQVDIQAANYKSPHWKIIFCSIVLSNRGVKLTVVVGSHELKKSKSAISHMEVKLYHIHPKFDSENLLNDIMLLQVNHRTQYVSQYDENETKKYHLWNVVTFVVAGYGLI